MQNEKTDQVAEPFHKLGIFLNACLHFQNHVVCVNDILISTGYQESFLTVGATVVLFWPVFSKKNIVGRVCDGMTNDSLQDKGLLHEFAFCTLGSNIWFELNLSGPRSRPLRVGSSMINQGCGLALGLQVGSINSSSLNSWALE